MSRSGCFSRISLRYVVPFSSRAKSAIAGNAGLSAASPPSSVAYADIPPCPRQIPSSRSTANVLSKSRCEWRAHAAACAQPVVSPAKCLRASRQRQRIPLIRLRFRARPQLPEPSSSTIAAVSLDFSRAAGVTDLQPDIIDGPPYHRRDSGRRAVSVRRCAHFIPHRAPT